MLVVALLAASVLAQSTCPQDVFLTKTDYELATSDDVRVPALSIKWWWNGISLIGTSSGSTGTTVPAQPTPFTDGQSLTASSVLKVFTNDELAAAENQEQLIFLFARISTTATGNGCILSIGNTVTPTSQQKGLCLGRMPGDQGQGITVISAPGFYQIPVGTLSQNFLIRIRRYLVGTAVKVDLTVSTDGSPVTRTGLDDTFDVSGSSIKVEAPKVGPNMATGQHSVGAIILLQGEPRSGQDTTSLFAAATSFLQASACIYETWTVDNGVVVPAANAKSNMVLKYTRQNFGPVTTAVATTVTFKAAPGDGQTEGNALAAAGFFFTNYTSITATGGTLDAAQINGGGSALQIPALNSKDKLVVTFTAGVANCTRTALPLFFGSGAPTGLLAGGVFVSGTSNAIAVGSSTPAFVYIQRRAKLTLINEDLSYYTQRGTNVVPSGCASPFVYTVDVFNEGPSCVTGLQLDLRSGITQPAGVTVGGPQFFTDAGEIKAGQLSTVLPAQVSIDADASAANWASLSRAIVLVAPTDTDLTSDTATSFVNGTNRLDSPIFQQYYEVQRYGDLRISSSATTAPSEAGATTLLTVELRVTSDSCQTVNNIGVDIDIELPHGVNFYDITSTGAALNDADGNRVNVVAHEGSATTSVRRSVVIPSLARGATAVFTLAFGICHSAQGSVRVDSRISRDSSAFWDGEVEQLETFREGLGPQNNNVVKLINTDNDASTFVFKIPSKGAIVVRQECTEPKVVPQHVRAKYVGFESSSSSGSSDSVSDVELLKFSTCTLGLSNTAFSDATVKAVNSWDLPRGVHVAGWTASHGVFSDNVWVVDVLGSANSHPPAGCGAAPGGEVTLKIDLVSDRHGIAQWIAKIDEKASKAVLSGDKGGFESIVF